MNVLKRDAQRQILKLMCLDCGIRGIVEVTDHSPNTVRRHLAQFGEALAATHDRLIRGLVPRRLEVDEIWSYNYAKKPSRVARDSKRAPADVGAFYTWVAFDPDAKLVVSWHVGKRDFHTGLGLFTDLRTRLLSTPMITTDGFTAYPDLIEETFGASVEHIVIQKEIGGWWNEDTGDSGQYVKWIRKVAPPSSKADLSLASTSLVERFNATIRNYNSRFRRKTFKFSKKLENHVHAQAIAFAYYNFVKGHRGFKGPERHYTPAMKAGVTTKVWTYDDLLDEVDSYWAHKALKPKLGVVPPPQYVPLAAGEASPLPYFVMYSSQKREAKVHKGTCRNCRQGVGRRDGAGSNQWYAFGSEKEARICAEVLSPNRFSDCAICVTGRYSGARQNLKAF